MFIFIVGLTALVAFKLKSVHPSTIPCKRQRHAVQQTSVRAVACCASDSLNSSQKTVDLLNLIVPDPTVSTIEIDMDLNRLLFSLYDFNEYSRITLYEERIVDFATYLIENQLTYGK